MAVLVTEVFTNAKYALFFRERPRPYMAMDIRDIVSANTDTPVEIMKDGTLVNENVLVLDREFECVFTDRIVSATVKGERDELYIKDVAKNLRLTCGFESEAPHVKLKFADLKDVTYRESVRRNRTQTTIFSFDPNRPQTLVDGPVQTGIPTVSPCLLYTSPSPRD